MKLFTYTVILLLTIFFSCSSEEKKSTELIAEPKKTHVNIINPDCNRNFLYGNWSYAGSYKGKLTGISNLKREIEKSEFGTTTWLFNSNNTFEDNKGDYQNSPPLLVLSPTRILFIINIKQKARRSLFRP